MPQARTKPSHASPAGKSLTGVPGLDSVMSGGYPSNRMFLVEGDPGTGKTTLGLQFLLEGVRHGEQGFYVTLSETADELASVAASHGWSVDGIEIFEFMPDEEALSLDAQYTVFHPSAANRGDKVAVYLFDERLGTYLDRAVRLGMPIDKHMKPGRVTIRQIDPAEVSPGEFAHLIVDVTQSQGAEFVIIDSLNGHITAMLDERLLDICLHELMSYLAQRGVTTLLTLAQHGVFSSVSGSQAEVSYLADSLLMLRFFEAHGEVRKAISVLKKRSKDHELTIREFQITNREVQVGEPLRDFQGVLTGLPDYLGQQSLFPVKGSRESG